MFLLWFFLLGSFVAHGDTPSLTLSEAIHLGLNYSPDLQSSQAFYREQIALKDRAQRSLGPRLLATASNFYQKKPSRLSTTTSSKDYDMALHFTQPLYAGGQLTNGLKSLELSEEMARLQTFSVRQKVIKNLILTYYDLAQSQQELFLADQHREVLKSYSNIVARYESIGRARKMDRLQATVNLSLTDAEKTRVGQQGELASSMMKTLLGSAPPIFQSLKIIPVIWKPNKDERQTDNIKTDSAETWNQAEKRNPDLALAILERQRQEYDNLLQKAEDLPSLDLVGDWGFQSASASQWLQSPSHYYAIGLHLTFPLFSNFTSFAKRRAHVESLNIKDQAIEIRRQELRQNLQSALISLKNETSRRDVAQLAAQQGREALELANEGFKQGIVSSQDVLNAQRTRYDSEKLWVESQFAYLKALLETQYLMGTDLEPLYSR